MKNDILYAVKAQRGPTLRCKGWKQESLLRMLENNMENAEKPERLVIYGGIGKCARLSSVPPEQHDACIEIVFGQRSLLQCT